MAGDRIVINSLERALSGDVNDLQAVASRVFADYALHLAASRSLLESGGTSVPLTQSATLGLQCQANTNTVLVGEGTLFQYSTTHPAAPVALESSMRVGMQRSSVAVAIPTVVDMHMIVEMRIVDVTTVSATRDIFDVPTQTFVPTSVSKRIERQIEYQVIQGSATALPAFSGGSWIPLVGFKTDGSGQVPSFLVVRAVDFRTDLLDLLAGVPTRFTLGTSPESYVESHALHSGGALLGGNFVGRMGSQRVWLRSDEGMGLARENTVNNTGNEFQHIYLCPLIANGVVAWPTLQTILGEGSARGIPMRAPYNSAVGGPHNDTALVWHASEAFANFDNVPVGAAMYVTGIYVAQGGFGSMVPFTCSKGGRLLLRSDRTGTPNNLVKAVNRALATLSGTEELALNFQGLIPDCARTAICRFRIGGTDATNAFIIEYRLERDGSNLLVGPFGRLSGTAGTADSDGSWGEFEVPVHEEDGTTAAMVWDFVIQLISGTSPDCVVEVDVIGWTY